MSLDLTKDVLFVGRGSSAVAYYRCALPAIHLGCDWSGILGSGEKKYWTTGIVRGQSKMPDFSEYKIVVLQQPVEPEWFDDIQEMQKRGTTVLFEIDDYIHGIPKTEGHDFAKHFTKEYLRRTEALMRMCDGLIVSTEFLAKRYRKFNRNVYVCRNGIDPKRYQLTRPERETVNIGWAGGTGHVQGLYEWGPEVLSVMLAFEHTTFITIGQPFATAFVPRVGEKRALAIPFVQIEQYPAAMTMLDIAIAPAGRGSFFRGKSDLRWLEASALKIPLVADPVVYPDITHGVDGFHVHHKGDVATWVGRLVENPELRSEVGERAYEYVMAHRTMNVACYQWVAAFEQILKHS